MAADLVAPLVWAALGDSRRLDHWLGYSLHLVWVVPVLRVGYIAFYYHFSLSSRILRWRSRRLFWLNLHGPVCNLVLILLSWAFLMIRGLGKLFEGLMTLVVDSDPTQGLTCWVMLQSVTAISLRRNLFQSELKETGKIGILTDTFCLCWLGIFAGWLGCWSGLRYWLRCWMTPPCEDTLPV